VTEEGVPVASCEARADVALGHPWASLSCRRETPCRGVRRVVAAGPSPFPPVRG